MAFGIALKVKVITFAPSIYKCPQLSIDFLKPAKSHFISPDLLPSVPNSKLPIDELVSS
jgi:hypothetical protein